MNPRQPNVPRLGVKPSLVANARGSSPLLLLVQSKLSSDELWNIKSANELWICPFCLSGIAKRPGLTHLDSIARHLENCRHFALGKGQPQAREQIVEKRNYESMVHSAQSDPAWRVYDTDGVWISPFSLQRTPAVRATGGKLDNFLFQALAKHLAHCSFHRQGIVHPVDAVMLARELHRRIADVRRFTTFQMHSYADWRWVDAKGSWICPYTLFAVPQVRLATMADWSQAPNAVALHLITHCPRFATGQATPQTAEAIAQAAGPGGRNLPAPETTAPTPVSPTQILGTTTRTGLAILAPTPLSVPITGSGANPVLVSASGANPVLVSTSGANRVLPSTSGASPVIGPPPAKDPGQRSGGFLFNRTPRPQVPEPTSVTRALPSLPSTPTPRPAAPRTPPPPPQEPLRGASLPDDEMRPAASGHHGLPDGFPAALAEVGAQLAASLPDDEVPVSIPLDEVEDLPPATDAALPVLGDDLPPGGPQQAPAAQGDHLDWMDDADSSGYQVIPSPRTDMIHARKLQETLLQQPPAVPGFQFATRYEACADITGDFFLFINLPENRIGIALGDVSGHGVRAGLIMSMARKTLEIYAAQGAGPADTLARVNDALVADLGGKMFVSMVYGVLDPDEGVITWARAGHNPALRYNVISEQSSEIRPKGMVVGMKSGPLFRQSMDEEVTRLEPGDVFVLYTDGITETMNLQQEEFGTERLAEVLRQFASDGPEVVIDQIMDRLHHFRGPRPPNDDATMVALLVE